MKSLIIAVDMGNTSISFALARGNRILRRRRIATSDISHKNISRALKELTCGQNIEGSALCSVVPAMNHVWTRELRKVTGKHPILITHRLRLGVNIALSEPEKIGADRLANACAVAYRHGTPAIVVDFGTALTFDVVSKDNAYIGGVIAPGLPFMSDYLTEHTALLPPLEYPRRGCSFGSGSSVRKQAPAFGMNTMEAMLIGARTGYLGMVREILTRLRKYFKNHRIHVCATGGDAEWILSDTNLRIVIDRDLTLRGIIRIYELNK